MPRWLRLVRAMVGTGLAFVVGGGAVVCLIGLPFLIFGNLSLGELLFTAVRGAVLSFPAGVAFSALLALTARGRTFERLSLLRFGLLGAGVGVALFLLMGVTGAFQAWSLETGILNFTLLTSMGGGSAVATLLLARRSRRSLPEADEPPRLEE